MKPMEILIIDAKRNPQGLDANGLAGLIMSFKENHDASVIQEGNTLIMYYPNGEANAEFHCFNADTPENLVKNVSKLYEVLKKEGYKTAETSYDNPKINDLIVRTTDPKNVKISQGQFHEYIAKVAL
jgi:hypothetical protein